MEAQFDGSAEGGFPVHCRGDHWIIAVRPGPGKPRAVSGTESACGGVSSQPGQQSLGFAGCGAEAATSRSGRQKPSVCACRCTHGGGRFNRCRALWHRIGLGGGHPATLGVAVGSGSWGLRRPQPGPMPGPLRLDGKMAQGGPPGTETARCLRAIAPSELRDLIQTRARKPSEAR